MSDPSHTLLSLAYAASFFGAAGAILLRRVARGTHEAPPAIPVGKVQVWFYRPGDILGVMILFIVFTGLFAAASGAPEAEMTKITAGALIFGIVFQLILAGSVVAAALRLANLNQWLGWRWKNWPWLFLIGPGSVVLMALVLWGIHEAGYAGWMKSIGVEIKQDTVTLLENTKDPVILVLMVFLATVIAPLWEEVVFRGYLHPVLKKYGGVWTGALCSSLLFAAVHNHVASLLPLFLLALLMVWLYELTGSIWTPIAVHACFNATAVIGTFAARNQESPTAIFQGLLTF